MSHEARGSKSQGEGSREQVLMTQGGVEPGWAVASQQEQMSSSLRHLGIHGMCHVLGEDGRKGRLSRCEPGEPSP